MKFNEKETSVSVGIADGFRCNCGSALQLRIGSVDRTAGCRHDSVPVPVRAPFLRPESLLHRVRPIF